MTTKQLFYLNESDQGRLDLIAKKSGGGNRAAALRYSLLQACDEGRPSPVKGDDSEDLEDGKPIWKMQFRADDTVLAQIERIAKWLNRADPNSSAAVRYAIRKTAKKWLKKTKAKA